MIDRIKYDASSDELIIWKWPHEGIVLGSQLIVNQSQEAYFVKGGKALDVFGPGTHTLSSANLTLIGAIVNLPFGGKTPFAAEIWYVNKTVKRDLKWGTPSPIPLLDPKYNFLINVRAFGRWGMRINDTRRFISEIVGTMSSANHDMVVEYFIGEIVQKLSNILADLFTKEKVSIVEANSHLNELSLAAAQQIKGEFSRFGIEIINFNIERINIPDEENKQIQAVLGKRMEMEQLGGVQVGQGYVTAKTFETLEKAAENPGGLMAGALGIGLGAGAGAAIGKQLTESMKIDEQGSLSQQNAPTNPNNEGDDISVRLTKIKKLLDAGLISQQEYNEKRKQILDSI